MTNLNAALEKHPEANKGNVEETLAAIEEVPEDIRTAVRNNAVLLCVVEQDRRALRPTSSE